MTWSVQAFAALRGGLDAGQAAVAREADQRGHPIGAVFGRAREVAEPGMRAHHHQQVREAVDQDAEKGLRPVLPISSFSDTPSTPRMSMRSKAPVIASNPVA